MSEISFPFCIVNFPKIIAFFKSYEVYIERAIL